jgi:hypothetical protein
MNSSSGQPPVLPPRDIVHSQQPQRSERPTSTVERSARPTNTSHHLNITDSLPNERYYQNT